MSKIKRLFERKGIASSCVILGKQFQVHFLWENTHTHTKNDCKWDKSHIMSIHFFFIKG